MRIQSRKTRSKRTLRGKPASPQSIGRSEKRKRILNTPRAPRKSDRILRKGHRLDQYQFIDEHRADFGLRWLLRKMDLCPNAYYNYRKKRKASYHQRKEKIKQVILAIYHEYEGRPGYRMMKVFLERKKIFLSKNTVLKYMQELKIHSIRRPKKAHYHKGEAYKRFDNLLKQDFTSKKPNEKWCTDFTYLYLSDGAGRYNCSIIDLYDKSIAATFNGKRIDAALAIDTLKIALEKNKVGKDLILHSDQGSQFSSKNFTEYCEKEHIRQSMSRAGCPYDNSVMESFFGTFKDEFIKQHIFDTDEELNNGTIDYIWLL